MSGNETDKKIIESDAVARFQALLDAARQVIRDSATTCHKLKKELSAERKNLREVVLCAVEGLEALTETLDANHDVLPGNIQESLKAVINFAWQRLEISGVQRDGEPGEKIDLKRHRIIKDKSDSGEKGRIVLKVINRGILFQGKRLRDIAVVAGKGGQQHDTDRD